MSEPDAPQITLMDETGDAVGPFFPSGMNTVEAAKAGAELSPDATIRKPGAAAGEQAAEGHEVDDEAFDPGAYTVDDVLDYVSDNPDERDDVLAAEREGKNRTTLINQLENM